MSPRKVQADWKIGIKQCPCGQPNHLDETHCVRCGLGFGGARSRQPFRIRRLFRFVLLTTLTIYLTLFLSSSSISVQQSIALAQNTKADLETVENRLLALTSSMDWRNIRFGKETSAEDLILTLETKSRNWCSSSLTGTKRETRSSLRRTRMKRKSTAAKRRLPPRLRQLSLPPPGSPSTRCWWFMLSSGTFEQDPV